MVQMDAKPKGKKLPTAGSGGGKDHTGNKETKAAGGDMQKGKASPAAKGGKSVAAANKAKVEGTVAPKNDIDDIFAVVPAKASAKAAAEEGREDPKKSMTAPAKLKKGKKAKADDDDDFFDSRGTKKGSLLSLFFFFFLPCVLKPHQDARKRVNGARCTPKRSWVLMRRAGAVSAAAL
jgi:hypothetical protein